MTYTDVTKPVVISVSRATTFSVENYLRRMCILSNGETSLAVGEGLEVDSTTYLTQLGASDSSKVVQKLNSFFSFAGNKSVYVLEIGNGTIETQVNALRSFLDEEQVRVLNIVLPDEWYDGGGDSSINATFNTQGIGVVGNDGSYTINSETAFSFAVSTSGSKSLSLDATAPTSLKSSNSANLADAVKDTDFTFASSANGFTITLTADYYTKFAASSETLSCEIAFTTTSSDGGGVASADVGSATFTILKATETPSVSSGELSYTQTGEDISAVYSLMTAWESIDKQNLFFLKYPANQDPSVDIYFDKLKNFRALHLVAQNVYNDTYHGAAAVVGKTASSIFDISESQPASPLNYKAMTSIVPIDYSKTMKTALIDAPISFFSYLASNNVILSGRQLDGQPWEYYYFWYLTHYWLDYQISTLLLNGVNNPNSAVGYDQDGFDTIKSNIVSRLQTLQGWGVITNFAQSYDATSGEFTGLGDIVMPSYYTYIASNPDDYKNEIVGGISFYVQCGKFPRQVQMSVTLGS